MAQKMAKFTASAQFRQFPPEADGDFSIVQEADICAWRERLSAEFCIGQGKLKVVDDPFASA